MSAAASPVRVLYHGSLFTLGEFHLEPDDARWHQDNEIGEGYHVVFPGTAVRIAHEGREPVVTDANTVVLYEPHQVYRRDLLSERGDHCTFVVVEPSLLASLMGVSDPDRIAFDDTHRVAPSRSYLLQRLAARTASATGDRLAVEEAIVRALAPLFASDTTRPSWQRIVEDARALLAARYAENLSLAEIAASVFVSPFHLARTFRAHTGMSIHGYRTQLRLRAALLLLDGDDTLAGIAAATGFASHAHLTDAFRRTFGVPPSRARDLAAMSTMLEA